MNTNFRNLLIAAFFVLPGSLILSAYADDEQQYARIDPNLEIYANEAADECGADPSQVRATVTGIDKPVGILTVELYNDPDHFLFKQGRVRRVRVPAKGPTQTVCMTEHSAGTYAMAAYHDIDGDRKFKKKWNGLPLEPFALSNNPPIKALKFPKFSKSAFKYGPGGIDLELDLVSKKKTEEIANELKDEK